MAAKKRKLRITLTRSQIGSAPGARRTLAALGLRRVGQSVERPANDSVRGMVRAAEHLVVVDEV